jgi:hypothetical protein
LKKEKEINRREEGRMEVGECRMEKGMREWRRGRWENGEEGEKNGAGVGCENREVQ